MHPTAIFFITIFLPIFIVLLLLGPIYAGMCVGLLWLYGDPMYEVIGDPSAVLGIYEGLFHFWQGNMGKLGFQDFLLPAAGMPLLGLLLGFVFAHILIRYVRSVIRLH